MSVDATTISPGMGQCAITGKIVPEDELVVISGQRVCAEGKAILLDRLKGGQTLPGEWEKPTVLRRFCCNVLDALIIFLPLGILNAVLTTTHPGAFLLLGLTSLFITAAQIIYFGQMHGSRGKTVGKMAGKLRVVNNLDGSPISMRTAYVRALAYVGVGFLSGIVLMTGNSVLVMTIGIVVSIYAISNAVLALIDGSRQRALHDRIAGTRVVYLD